MKLPVMVLHMSIPHIFRRKDWFRNFIRTDAVWREKREGLSEDVLMHLENMTKGSSIPWRILGLHTAGLWSLQKISAFRRILWGGLRPVITMMHSGELQKSFCTNRIIRNFLFSMYGDTALSLNGNRHGSKWKASAERFQTMKMCGIPLIWIMWIIWMQPEIWYSMQNVPM